MDYGVLARSRLAAAVGTHTQPASTHFALKSGGHSFDVAQATSAPSWRAVRTPRMPMSRANTIKIAASTSMPPSCQIAVILSTTFRLPHPDSPLTFPDSPSLTPIPHSPTYTENWSDDHTVCSNPPIYIIKTSVILFYSFRDHIGPERKRPVSAEEQTCRFLLHTYTGLEIIGKSPYTASCTDAAQPQLSCGDSCHYFKVVDGGGDVKG